MECAIYVQTQLNCVKIEKKKRNYLRYFSVYRDHLYTGFTEGLNNFGMSDKNLQFPVHGFIPNLHKDLKLYFIME